MNTRLLFVYGSLLSEMGNHRCISDGAHEFLGEHTTESGYTMVSLGGFPAVLMDGEGTIKGEVYAVSEAVWERVERLEGYPSFYTRTTLQTPYGEAEMYVLHREDSSRSPIVPNGDWKEYYSFTRNYG